MKKYTNLFKKYNIEMDVAFQFLDYLKKKEEYPYLKTDANYQTFLENMYLMEKELKKSEWKFMKEDLSPDHDLIKEFFERYPMFLLIEYPKVCINHKVLSPAIAAENDMKITISRRGKWQGGYMGLKRILKQTIRR